MVARSNRLELPQVTLCAASSVNVKATLRALEASLARIGFAACKLFTDAAIKTEHPDISIVPIHRLNSSAAYSNFLLSHMVDHVVTSHCLVVQWDGHVLNEKQWRWEFLDCDYVGASWPQFDDGYDVGNGGFSLRSRRLMEACRSPQFRASHPEDVAIGRINRNWLERKGMRFAPRELANRFATERAGDLTASFGYHGVFNMPRAIGTDTFWEVYRELDDRSSLAPDFVALLKALQDGRSPILRSLRMVTDRACEALSGLR